MEIESTLTPPCDALPVELPSPLEQGGGDEDIFIQVFLMPIWLIPQGSPKGTLG